MKFLTLRSAFLVCTLVAAPLVAADKTDAPKAPAVKLPPQPPDVAAPKMGTNGLPNEAFLKAHASFVATAKQGKAQLVFLGDSITAGWNGNGKAVWTNSFAKYQPANFGIGGDKTQHVLWRIENGELDGIKPKAAVIMIGTNNSGSDDAPGIARGVTKIVEFIRKKTPKTKILLLAVFPRGDKPEGNLGAANEKLKQVNAILAKLDDGKHVHFLDIGDKFVPGAGPISKDIMPDFLHLSAAGYQIWADAITPKLAELMK
ncbi:MAG: GDSL family lipase [Verrucomicrobia bacterium]|nr:GDSL family lipase [Verrucomicrobiota bacterium]